YCYNLYTDQTIPRYLDPSMDFLRPSSDFDGADFFDAWNGTSWRTLRARSASLPGPANTRWDQNCVGPQCTNIQESLTAGEVVSILGSTQLCPYNYSDS